MYAYIMVPEGCVFTAFRISPASPRLVPDHTAPSLRGPQAYKQLGFSSRSWGRPANWVSSYEKYSYSSIVALSLQISRNGIYGV